MFKRQMTMLLLAGMWAASIQADTAPGLTMSVDLWDVDSSGSLADSGNRQNFDHGADTPATFSLALEHPVPLIPNVRLQVTDMSISDRAYLNVDFIFDGVTYPANASIGTEFNLRSSDFIFYYELLDNDTVKFDLGLNSKYLEGDIRVGDSASQSQVFFNGLVPMLYSAFEFGIPTTRFSVFGDFNLISMGNYTLGDYQAGTAYILNDNTEADFSVRGGYRKFWLELDDLGGFQGDWSFDGFFLGIEAGF